MAKEPEPKLLPRGQITETVKKPDVLDRPCVLDPYSPDLLIDGWINCLGAVEYHSKKLGVTIRGMNQEELILLRQRAAVMRIDLQDSVRSLSTFLLNDEAVGVPNGYEKKLRLSEKRNYVYSFSDEDRKGAVPFVEIELDPRDISIKQPTQKIIRAVNRISVFYEVLFRTQREMGNDYRSTTHNYAYESVWYANDMRARVLTIDNSYNDNSDNDNSYNEAFDPDLNKRIEASFFDNWKMDGE